MTIQPLEPSLWETLRVARLMPERANLGELMPRIDAALAQLSTSSARMTDSARLQAAGELLWQVADLCAVRAEALMTGWEETHRDPIVERSFFADVVRQTMAVDLSDLMKPAPLRKRRTKLANKLEGSVAAIVDKTAVLAMVEQIEAEASDKSAQKQQVLTISHSEDVNQWIAAITHCLEAAPTHQVHFVQLCQSSGLLQVEGWLAILFGGFELEQAGEFYSEALWVKHALADSWTESTVIETVAAQASSPRPIASDIQIC